MCIRDRNITVGITRNVVSYLDETLREIVVNMMLDIRTIIIITIIITISMKTTEAIINDE